MGGIYSPKALAEYAKWAGGYGYGDGVLKYAWDASRAGSKLQSAPLRSALEWPLYGYPRSYWQLGQEPMSPTVAFLLGMVTMWVVQTGVAEQLTGLLGVKAKSVIAKRR